MKTFFAAATVVVAASATAGLAGGIDRAGQRSDEILFKSGNYAEASVAYTWVDLSGSDSVQNAFPFPPGFSTGARYDDVGDDFASVGFGIKYDLTDRLSLAFTGSEDFGSDIVYDGDPARTLLGGTEAIADTYALTLMARYRFTENFSVHGGVRADRADGTIKLNGLAYGGGSFFNPATGLPVAGSRAVSGYEVDLDEDWGYGYLIGAAYEIPDIALRFAITYNSAIEHDFKTTETFQRRGTTDTFEFASGRTDVETPQSINIDFQTGIAEDTLLFAGFRWADWSEFEIAPEIFQTVTNTGLVSLNDSYTYELGVARRFTEEFAASAAVLYEEVDGDSLVSPLAPSRGFTGIALGGSYRIDNIELSGGVRYLWLGDAKPETGTPDTERASFRDNEAITVGFKVGVYF